MALSCTFDAAALVLAAKEVLLPHAFSNWSTLAAPNALLSMESVPSEFWVTPVA